MFNDKMLERKKDICVEMMKLGMDFKTACVAAEMTSEEIEKLEGDERFVALINYTLAKKERELLEKFNEVAERNAERGDTRQIERLLELMNPARYSKVTKLSHQLGNDTAGGGKVTIEFVGDEGQNA